MNSGEEMVDYLIRAEELSSSLGQAGEKISDSLLISVTLKGLSVSFDYFYTVYDFSKVIATFTDVKKVLMNFATSKSLRQNNSP